MSGSGSISVSANAGSAHPSVGLAAAPPCSPVRPEIAATQPNRSNTLLHTWKHFLAGSVHATILKKFLADKIDPDRCGFSDVFELDQAA